MKYIKNLLLSLKEIFFVMICQYLILIITLWVLGIDKSLIWATIFLSLFQLLFSILKLHKKEIIYHKNSYFPYLLLGVSISTIYNMIILGLGKGFIPTEKVNILLVIISSGIIGPIFEEVIFRYVLINKLKNFNSTKTTILLSAIIFGLFHNNLITVIYAIVIGIVNALLYIKKKSLLPSILVHISANMMTQLLFDYNFFILILGCILFLLSLLIIKREEH